MEIQYTRARYFSLILILGSLTALGPFSIDMYLPGFPAIAEDLHTNRVALSLSSYFIGISAGQLLYGPLLDRFGRKKPLYIGLLLYIIASAGCMAARTIDSLIILRFIQAVGSCAAAVASVAMVRDLFPVKDTPKVFSLLLLVVAASPMLAPTAGGYVTAAFGWHAVFAVLGILGALVLIASLLWLPDSHQPDTSLSLKPGPIITNFLSVIKVPQFYVYALTGAVAFSGLFAYVSGSPHVFMEVFHMNKKIYGWVFAGLSVGFIGSSQLNTLFLRKYTSQQIVFGALICQSVIGIAFWIAAISGWLNIVSLIVFLFLFLACLGFANPNTGALTLAPFARNAGSASAVMGALQMGAGSLASMVISLFETPTAAPMAMTMAGTAILALLLLLWGRGRIREEVVATGENTGVLH